MDRNKNKTTRYYSLLPFRKLDKELDVAFITGDVEQCKVLVQKLYENTEKFKLHLLEDVMHTFLENVCKIAHINTIKYIFEEIGVTLRDVRDKRCDPIRYACRGGKLETLKYFFETVGCTKQDFQANNNAALGNACKNGKLDIVKYMCETIGLGKEDFQNGYDPALRRACEWEQLNVVEYIFQRFGFTKADVEEYWDKLPEATRAWISEYEDKRVTKSGIKGAKKRRFSK